MFCSFFSNLVIPCFYFYFSFLFLFVPCTPPLSPPCSPLCLRHRHPRVSATRSLTGSHLDIPNHYPHCPNGTSLLCIEYLIRPTPLNSRDTRAHGTNGPVTVLLVNPGETCGQSPIGCYIALKEFLGDNLALSQRLDETAPASSHPSWPTQATVAHMREISSALQWAYCLLSYIAVRCEDSAVRDMLAFGRIVLNLAQKHGGSGWLEYDRAFRQQSSADPSIRWNSLNPSLMVLAAPSTTPGSFCPHCQEVDHSPPDCALLPFLERPGTRQFPARPKSPAHLPLAQPRRYAGGLTEVTVPTTLTVATDTSVECQTVQGVAKGHTIAQPGPTDGGHTNDLADSS